MPYTIDASGFIYFVETDTFENIDVVEWFEQLFQAGLIVSIEAVRIELTEGNDTMAQWAYTEPELFLPSTAETDKALDSVRDVVNQVVDEIGYSRKKYDDFFDGADGYLIAHAIVIEGSVVTEEAKFKRGKIQIPQICERMDVPCIDMKTMLSELPTEFSADLLSLLQE